MGKWRFLCRYMYGDLMPWKFFECSSPILLLYSVGKLGWGIVRSCDSKLIEVSLHPNEPNLESDSDEILKLLLLLLLSSSSSLLLLLSLLSLPSSSLLFLLLLSFSCSRSYPKIEILWSTAYSISDFSGAQNVKLYTPTLTHSGIHVTIPKILLLLCQAAA